MGQQRRFDGPGVRHHVMNRGIGKRLMFAGRRDRRQFLAAVACAVRAQLIQIEAYAIMGNHFHMVVWTPAGTLSDGMQRIQNTFSRWFNRRNQRDGPLPRGRFRSRPIEDDEHLFATFPYIDHNPVKAGLCLAPTDWEAGSARHYATGRFPPWMSPERVLRMLEARCRPGEPLTQAYARILGPGPTRHEDELIRTRFGTPASRVDDMDFLPQARKDGSLRWLVEKARNADGLAPGRPIVPASAIEHAVALARAEQGELLVRVTRKAWDAWDLLTFGTQNLVSGLGGRALARRHRVSQSTATRRVARHRRAIDEDPAYADAMRALVELATAVAFARHRGAMEVVTASS